MNWYNDYRRVTFITNEARKESRRRGLGFFGWLGVMVWLLVGAFYCSHKAHAQSPHPGIWMMDCTEPTLCLPLRSSKGNIHVYETQTACETDLTQVMRDLPSGRRIACLPTTYQNMPAPIWRPAEVTPLGSRATDCAWVGPAGPTRRLICNNR